MRGGIVAVAVVVGAGVAAGVDHDGTALVSAAPAGASGPSPATTEPPTDHDLQQAVDVESGMTPGQVMACDTAGGRATGWYPSSASCPPEDLAVIGDGVSYGLVVENTSDQVLLNVPVTYRFLDATGSVVPEPVTAFSDSDRTADSATIPILWPDERYGLGGMSYRDRPGATQIEVEVGMPDRWVPPMEAEVTYGGFRADEQVEITGITVGYGDDGEPIVRFGAQFPAELAAAQRSSGDGGGVGGMRGFAVYRDAQGRIIGGADSSTDIDIGVDEPEAGEIALDDPLVVPGIDPTEVEVFVRGLLA